MALITPEAASLEQCQREVGGQRWARVGAEGLPQRLRPGTGRAGPSQGDRRWIKGGFKKPETHLPSLDLFPTYSKVEEENNDQSVGRNLAS